MGDEIRVTVIAAGFDRVDGAPVRRRTTSSPSSASVREHVRAADIFGEDEEDDDLELGDGDDDFDVPSFLR